MPSPMIPTLANPPNHAPHPRVSAWRNDVPLRSTTYPPIVKVPKPNPGLGIVSQSAPESSTTKIVHPPPWPSQQQTVSITYTYDPQLQVIRPIFNLDPPPTKATQIPAIPAPQSTIHAPTINPRALTTCKGSIFGEYDPTFGTTTLSREQHMDIVMRYNHLLAERVSLAAIVAKPSTGYEVVVCKVATTGRCFFLPMRARYDELKYVISAHTQIPLHQVRIAIHPTTGPFKDQQILITQDVWPGIIHSTFPLFGPKANVLVAIDCGEGVHQGRKRKRDEGGEVVNLTGWNEGA